MQTRAADGLLAVLHGSPQVALYTGVHKRHLFGTGNGVMSAPPEASRRSSQPPGLPGQRGSGPGRRGRAGRGGPLNNQGREQVPVASQHTPGQLLSGIASHANTPMPPAQLGAHIRPMNRQPQAQRPSTSGGPSQQLPVKVLQRNTVGVDTAVAQNALRAGQSGAASQQSDSTSARRHEASATGECMAWHEPMGSVNARVAA